ncbi:MAG: hypothetical protein UFG06_14070 [Lachnospiraceae bacterium]|nr:hypothetical protein [Lachnospiraceae bacterium]
MDKEYIDSVLAKQDEEKNNRVAYIQSVIDRTNSASGTTATNTSGQIPYLKPTNNAVKPIPVLKPNMADGSPMIGNTQNSNAIPMLKPTHEIENKPNSKSGVGSNYIGNRFLGQQELIDRGKMLNDGNKPDSAVKLYGVPEREASGVSEAKDFSKFTDDELAKAYEKIGNYNVIERLFDKDKDALYAVKQQLSPTYNNSLRENVYNDLVDNGYYEKFLEAYIPKTSALTGLTAASLGDDMFIDSDTRDLRNWLSVKTGYSEEELKNLANSIFRSNVLNKTAEVSNEHRALSSALSIPIKFAGNLQGTAYGLKSSLTGEPIESDNLAFLLQDMAGTTTQTVEDTIDNPIGKFAYSTGMSIGNSLFSRLAGAGTGILSSMSAYSETIQDGAERGLTPNQMQTTALAAAAFEYAFEKISWGRLEKIARGEISTTLAKQIASQMATEGLEEVGTDVANTIVDNLVNGDAAELVQMKEIYINSGMSEAEAQAAVMKDYAKQLGLSFAGGAVSGGVMGGGASAIGRVAGNNIQNNSVQNQQNILNDSNTGINAGQATNIKSPYTGDVPVQDTLNNARVDIPQDAYNNAVTNMNTAEIDSTMTGRNVKKILTKVYENIFPDNSTAIQISVNGLQFDGKNYIVTVNKGAVGKIMSDSHLSAEKICVLDNIDDIISNSNYVGSGNYISHGKNEKVVTRYDYFETQANINNQSYIVAFDVEVVPGKNNYRTHKVINEINLTRATDAGTSMSASVVHSPSGETGPVPAAQSGASSLSNNSIPNSANNVNASRPKVMAEDTGIGGSSIQQSENYTLESYPSRTATNTFRNSNMFKTVEQNLEMLNGEIAELKMNVDKKTEVQSIKEAADNLSRDYEGTVRKLENSDAFNGVNTDEAMMALENRLNEAKHTGDYGEVKKWMRMIADKAHSAGQALQAFAKYSRTSEGTLVKGENYLKGKVDKYVKENPKGVENAERTAADLWNELQSAQKNADFFTPFAKPGTGAISAEKIQSLVENALKKIERRPEKTDIDYLAEQLHKGIDEARLNEEILTYTATGVFGLTDADIEQVINLFDEAEKYGEFSKQRYDLEQQAINIIAKRITKADFMDKWNAWRYLSMLGNPKTHLRNKIGNTVFGMVTGVKNNVAALIESGVDKVSKNGIDRTKAILNPKSEADRSLISASKKDATDGVYTLLIDGGNKYNMANDIERNKTIYNTKFLEKIRQFNDDMLNKEDFTGLRNKYATSLAGYLKANHADTSIFTSKAEADVKLLNDARAYAIEQAKIATFHEYNSLASAINQFSQNMKNKGGAIGTGTHVLMEGILPFKKTPANIAKQGIKYSPVSLVTGVYQMYKSVRTGKYTASQAIDTFTQGLTGTAIMAVGAALYSLGLLNGGPDDEDKKAGFDKLTGRQNYALTFGNSTYTIDWLAPFALPLFAGVELMKQYDETGDVSVSDALTSLSEPMFEMSMLQGINDTLENVRYGEEGKAFKTIAINAATNYASQAVPTLFGQVARAVDDTRRSTYTGQRGVKNQLGRALNTAENKIPVLSMTNQPYVDAWGNTQENIGGSFLGRLAYNMLSPGYYSQQDTSTVNTEIEKIYGETGDTSVLPSTARNTITFDGQSIKLSPKEYTQYAQEKGQLQYELVDMLFASSSYDSMSDDVVIELLTNFYKAAGNIAQNNLGYTTKDQKIYTIYKDLGSEGILDYYLYKLDADTDGNGYLKQQEVISYLDNLPLPLLNGEKAKWFDIYCPDAKANPYR